MFKRNYIFFLFLLICTHALAVIQTNPSIVDATCFGTCDGSISLNPSGGIAPYHFNWSNGATSNTVSLQCAGSYVVTITDSLGETVSDTFFISQPSEIVITNRGVRNATCHAASNGSISITVTGGNFPYTYLWTGPNGFTSAVEDPTGLTAGSYTVIVTDANGCQKTLSNINVAEPAEFTYTAQITNAHCFGGNDGAIHFTLNGGTPPFTYVWTHYIFTPVFTIDTIGYSEDVGGLTAGTYNVSVRDTNGCVGGIFYFVSEPSQIVLSAVVTDVLCPGDNNGSIDLTASGGTGVISYHWSSGANSQDLDNEPSGSYSVTATDLNNCTVAASFTIDSPDTLSVSASVTDVSCYGFHDGSMDITVNGGTAPYAYSWTGPNGFISASQHLSGLFAGTYNVSVTDSNNCSKVYSIPVSEPDPISSSILPSDITCYGAGDGSMSILVSGGTPGYSYNWKGPNGYGSVSQNLMNLEAGIYELTVTDSKGCLWDTAVTLFEPDSLILNLAAFQYYGGSNISCFGSNDGSINLTVSGGTAPYFYEWAGPAGFTSLNEDITGLAAGTYFVTVTDLNGCTSHNSVVLVEPDTLHSVAVAALYTGGNNISCNGSTDGSIDLTITGGTPPYHFSWTGPNGFTSINQDLSGLNAGTYFVTVTDTNGCMDSLQITLTEPDTLSVVAVAVQINGGNNISCNGSEDGAINLTVTGGTAPYIFSWTGPNGFTSSNQNLSGLIAGTYSVTVTDTNGCTDSAQVILMEPDTISVIAITATFNGGNNISCAGLSDGSIDLTVTGGTPPYSFSWMGPNGFTSSNEDLTGLSGGTYAVTVTDTNGCMNSTLVTLIEPDTLQTVAISPQYNGGNNITCGGASDGSINLIVTGGTAPYVFNWSGPNGFTSSSEDLSGLAAGTYYVTVSDTNGCIDSASVTLLEPDSLEVTLTSQNPGGNAISCFGSADGIINLTVTGGTQPYVFSWSGPNGFISSDSTLRGLEAGDYIVIVTDANGCMDSSSITLTQPEQLHVVTVAAQYQGGANISCYGQSDGSIDATASGGTTPYTFQWTGPNSFSSNDEDISGLAAGTYYVTVTDSNGCMDSTNVILVEPDTLTVIATALEFTGANNVSCNGSNDGSVDLTVTGGTAPYVFNWNGPNGFTSSDEDINGLTAGSYSVIVIDANGCMDSTSITLTEPDSLLSLAVSPEFSRGNNISCFGQSDGSIDLTVTGGTAPYIFSWTGPGGFSSGDEDLNGLAAGIYSVIVTDTNGCVDSTSITLTQPDSMELVAIAVDYSGSTQVSCNGSNDGAIDLTISGGNPPYIINWTGPNGFISTDEDLSGLPAGTYSVQVTDTNGCQSQTSVTLEEPDSLQSVAVAAQFNGGNNISCYGSSDGSIDLTVTGGSAPYSINWNGPGGFNSTDEDLSGLVAGIYSVTVVDTNGCQDSTNVTLIEPDSLNTVAVALEYNGGNNISCNGQSDGSVTITVTGGTDPYSYSWTGPNGFASSDSTLTSLVAGDYYLTVTDANACKDSTSVTLTEPDSLIVIPDITSNFNGVPISCNGESDGSVNLIVSGGSIPYHYWWSTGDTTASVTGLPAGDYWAVVGDTNNCSTDTAFITIDEPDSITVSVSQVQDVNCNQGSDGAIDIQISGGIPPYSYHWETGDTTQNLINLEAGEYCVLVSDTNNCFSDTICAVISEPDEISITSETTPITCNGFEDGAISINASGGTPGYEYSWSTSPDDTTHNISGLGAGTYSVTVTDMHSCTAELPINIVDIDPITIDASTSDVSCEFEQGIMLGSVDLSVTGGTPDYTYFWSTSGTVSSLEDLEAGSYGVTVTDMNGCVDSIEVMVGGPSCIPIPFNDTSTTFQNMEVLVPVLANDISPAGSSTVVTSIITNPVNGSAAIDSTGFVLYTPNTDFTGMDTFVYVISCDEEFPVVPCFSAIVYVSVLPGRPNIFIPNGFSPNGDGINDDFHIDGIENFPDNELIIFNRWGNKVNEFSPYLNNWKGTNKDGEDLPDGTYYYILKLNDADNTTYTGYVVINR